MMGGEARGRKEGREGKRREGGGAEREREVTTETGGKIHNVHFLLYGYQQSEHIRSRAYNSFNITSTYRMLTSMTSSANTELFLLCR